MQTIYDSVYRFKNVLWIVCLHAHSTCSHAHVIQSSEYFEWMFFFGERGSIEKVDWGQWLITSSSITTTATTSENYKYRLLSTNYRM